MFQINAGSGVITTAVALKDIENLVAAYTLVIKAKDLESDQYDLATVPITLSQWDVQRNNGSKAPATSGIGCTIAELADEIGLKPSEFRDWLAIPTEYVPLANGDVIHRNDLGLDTPLGVYSACTLLIFPIQYIWHGLAK